MKDVVYIQSIDGSSYPVSEDFYSPSEAYPEYQFDVISRKKNDAYSMVRECLYGLGLDTENYGKSSWNPLGCIIKEGNNVLIKPNLVKHNNPAGGIECLVTNASVLRPIVDYVLIALRGSGKITIGDAPVQSCDINSLYTRGGYNKLIEFYHSKGISIEFEDFRGTISYFDEQHNLVQTSLEEQDSRGVLVNLGNISAFVGVDHLDRLRVTNYAPRDLVKHHGIGKHEYLVSRTVLEADVVINVPKPKTHRKAGITGALKNVVGICVEKEYLPHHKQGSKDEGGDEYKKRDAIHKLRSHVYDRRDTANCDGNYHKAKAYTFITKLLYCCLKLKDRNNQNYQEGDWYGNDTIWRTVLDLNRILQFADANGEIHQNRMREVLTIADMIVTGEGNGPLSPTSNAMGMIVAGFDSVNVDKVVASIMGIDYRKIPCIQGASTYLQQQSTNCGCTVRSNKMSLNFDSIELIEPTEFRHVVMPKGWDKI